MKSISTTLFMIAVSLATTSFSNRRPRTTFSLTVLAKELRNSDGTLQFALYNREGSIPDEHYKNYFRFLKTDISNGSAQITFYDIPAGTYAVNIHHDENSNGKIDKGWVLPKEGIGFSNYESIGLRNKPSFEKASFFLREDKSISIKVIYM
ncbi:MAG TPA: DUF2141 domain-containing protein [Cyclobacteriaceae bacterium]|nr:DUF2141 domain-containing protein [Cyclobacteriaceae bacterium]